MATLREMSTYAVVQTPIGRGAVAVIVVSGPAAVEAVDAHFVAANGRPLAAQPANTIRFGRWASSTGEEVVVCRRLDPSQSAIRNRQSAIVEVHCHGGHAAAAAILADLRGRDCETLGWPKGLRRSAADPLVAEVQIALATAPTERAAAILLDQYHGALTHAIRTVLESLDRGDLDGAARQLEALLARAELGLHLTAPWRVVLAGPPNVGKSSLINALVGYGRSIVFNEPGTTRDVVTVRTAVDGWPVELADTAGLRAADKALEAAGVALATSALEMADLVILVSDATRQDDAGMLPPSMTQRLLRVRNKTDLVTAVSAEQLTINTSAMTGAGLESLLSAIAQALVPVPPKPGAAVPFTQSQQAALERVSDAVGAGNAPTACKQLQALLAGRAVS